MIGITQRLEQNMNYYEIRECLSIEWGQFLYNLDYIPLSYSKPIEKYKINGIIFSGGNDLSSLNQNTLSKIRDSYESTIIEYCAKNKIPIFGVCRGAQHLAYKFNSKLHSIDNHVNKNHRINFNNKTYEVNSFHNYCITKIGDGLEILATAEDDTIEAFKHKELPFFGIMWHIEREKSLSIPSIQLWDLFLKAIKDNQ